MKDHQSGSNNSQNHNYSNHSFSHYSQSTFLCSKESLLVCERNTPTIIFKLTKNAKNIRTTSRKLTFSVISWKRTTLDELKESVVQ